MALGEYQVARKSHILEETPAEPPHWGVLAGVHRDHRRPGSGAAALTLSIPSKFRILRFQTNSQSLLGKPLDLLYHEKGLPPLSCSTLPALHHQGADQSQVGMNTVGMAPSPQTADGRFRSNIHGCCIPPITQHKSSQIWSLFREQASALNPCSLS